MADPSGDDPAVDEGLLLRRIRRGDVQALSLLIRRYQQRLFHLTLRVCGDATLAEEATVESFYKIWRNARQWRDETGPSAWICRIAVRTVLDLNRGRRRWRRRTRIAGEAREQDSASDIIQDLIERERQERLTDAVDRALAVLKAEDRALVHMYYFENMRLREIAPILDASQDALKMRLSRARQKLKDLLEDFDNE
ncbi:MAG: RNA polymerase sigma factor [Planctomycetaceae bacterium]